MAKQLIEWSDYQEQIFEETLNSTDNLIIEAVAGGAKTTVLVEAAKRFTAANRTAKTAFLAFNNHIARELKGRLGPGIEARTMHSLGFGSLKYSLDRTIEVDEDKVRKILQQVLPVPNARGDRAGWARTKMIHTDVRRLVSMLKNTCSRPDYAGVDNVVKWYGVQIECPEGWDPPVEPPPNLPVTGQPATDAKVRRMAAYKTYLAPICAQVMNVCRQQLRTIDFDDMIWLPVELGARVRPRRFSLVLVDEGQDLNECQIRFLGRLHDAGSRLVIVGDRNQAIYVWRGARVDSMDQLQKRFEAKPLPLSVCYRCPEKHLVWARTLVPHVESAPGAAQGRIERRWWVNAMNESRSGDLCIARTNAPLAKGAFYHIRHGRKAVVRGRDLGQGLIDLIDELGGGSLGAMVDALGAWEAAELAALDAADDRKGAEAVVDKCETIRVLAAEAESIDDLKDRITEIFSDSLEGIVFSSIHRAKGLEGNRVVILEPHKMPLMWKDPGPWDFQQEQNVLYVALTRAKEDLVLAIDPDEERSVSWLRPEDLDMDDLLGVTDGGSPTRMARLAREQEIEAEQNDPTAIAARLSRMKPADDPDGLFS